MVIKHSGANWPELPSQQYKNEPGTWMDVSRRVLFDGERSQFQVRYFEIEPGGYTSYEQHEHEHCVVVLRGSGEVRLDDAWSAVDPMDTVIVSSRRPHQFRNTSDEPFGILCIVDRERDRPVLLDPDGSCSSMT